MNDVQTVVRLPSSLVRDIDALAKKMSEPGLKITRASVIRMLITQGVTAAADAEARKTRATVSEAATAPTVPAAKNEKKTARGR